MTGSRLTVSTLFAGASGYSFKEWKGSFYPGDMTPEGMLRFYAERLSTVEINNTFYQMPKAAVLENWAASTPQSFRFAIKAPRRITHLARLDAEKAADSVAYLYKTLAVLGPKKGPVLFQLPPFLKKDVGRLTAFLGLLPEGHAAAFEFRNDTWFTDDVYAALASFAREALGVLIVEEDTTRIADFADRVFLVDEGRVAWCGDTAEMSSSSHIVSSYLGA